MKKSDNEREVRKYKRTKTFCFVLAIVLSLTIVGLIYYYSSSSNVYAVRVDGNVYLKDSDIVDLSGLSDEDKFLLVNPRLIEKRILENKAIKECSVELLDKNLVKINVEEYKMIAYTFLKGECVIILENNERIVVDGSNIYLINNIPLIEGFTNDDLVLIEKNLKDVDYKMINEISEIHYYPELKYQYVQIIMRDGNNIFASVYGMNVLNSYYAIESSYDSDEEHCIYFEDISQNAYASACPWQGVKEDIVIDDDVDN